MTAPRYEEKERRDRQSGEDRAAPSPRAEPPDDSSGDEHYVEPIVEVRAHCLKKKKAQAEQETRDAQKRRRSGHAPPGEPRRGLQRLGRAERRCPEEEEQDLVSFLFWTECYLEGAKGADDDDCHDAGHEDAPHD